MSVATWMLRVKLLTLEQLSGKWWEVGAGKRRVYALLSCFGRCRLTSYINTLLSILVKFVHAQWFIYYIKNLNFTCTKKAQARQWTPQAICRPILLFYLDNVTFPRESSQFNVYHKGQRDLARDLQYCRIRVNRGAQQDHLHGLAED